MNFQHNLGKHPAMPVKPLMKTAMKAPKRKMVKRVTKRKIRCQASVLMAAIAKWKDKRKVSTTREAMRRGVVLNLKFPVIYLFCFKGYLCPTAALMSGTVTVGTMQVTT